MLIVTYAVTRSLLVYIYCNYKLLMELWGIYQNIIIFFWTYVNIRYSNLEGAEYIRPTVATSGWSFNCFSWQELVCFWWIYRRPKSIQRPLYAWYWYVQYSLQNTFLYQIFVRVILWFNCLFIYLCFCWPSGYPTCHIMHVLLLIYLFSNYWNTYFQI
jgi:hypothetical protein